MKNLEVYNGQLATTIISQQKGKFPSDREINCNAAFLILLITMAIYISCINVILTI